MRELSRQREKATQFTSETGKKAVDARESKKHRLPSTEGSRSEPKERSRGTSQRIAKRVGISAATYERSKKIIEQKNELRMGSVVEELHCARNTSHCISP
ncbi:MAG: hypothetical protein WAM42_17460, partial [Candidatus Nitrosopolaris sp.]